MVGDGVWSVGEGVSRSSWVFVVSSVVSEGVS